MRGKYISKRLLEKETFCLGKITLLLGFGKNYRADENKEKHRNRLSDRKTMFHEKFVKIFSREPTVLTRTDIGNVYIHIYELIFVS